MHNAKIVEVRKGVEKLLHHSTGLSFCKLFAFYNAIKEFTTADSKVSKEGGKHQSIRRLADGAKGHRRGAGRNDSGMELLGRPAGASFWSDYQAQ